MKKIFTILTFFVVFFTFLSAKNNIPTYNRVTLSALSPLPVNGDQGVSAPFAGHCGSHILVCGGCNFPGIPASEGGAKVFYDKIFTYDLSSTSDGMWKEIGHLSRAKAYGACVTVSDGIVLIGGTDGTVSLPTVEFIHYDGGTLKMDTLPSLPVGLDNMGAATDGKNIYVAGGQSNGVGSFGVYCLSYPNGKSWEKLADMPGSFRLQPSCAIQKGANGNNFYVMGGFTAASGKTTGIVHNDGVCYNVALKHWTKVSNITDNERMRALVGAAAVPSGCAHIVFFGGVNFEIFEDAINCSANRCRAESKGDTAMMAIIDQKVASYMHHPASWYKFNDKLLVYHTITDTWSTESQSPLLARAGAAVVDFGNQWIVVDGESQPGIRSADVTAVKISSHPHFGWINWSVLMVYLLLMLLLGFYFMKREDNSDDFFKGGGRIPWWAAGVSIYATMLSAITYMAYPAKTYSSDWTYFPMLFTILLVAFPVIRYYLPFFHRLHVTSAYEYLELRFNLLTRMMASALFIIFMIARMALVLYLPSLALTAVTGIDIHLCIILMGAITILYCTMGGVEAVVWGDVVQGIILVGGALVAFFFLVNGLDDGWSTFMEVAQTDHKLKLFDWSFDYRSATFWVIIIGGFVNNFISYTSDQTIIQRYMTSKDENGAKKSILLNGAMSVVVTVVFFVIGTGLYVFYKTSPSHLDFTMDKTDTIFPFFMMNELPSGVAGLLIAALFSATMSTISSNINAVSSAFSVDFYKRCSPHVSERQMLKVARYACLVAGLIGLVLALLMATWDIYSMLDFFQEILGLLTSGLGGLFLMGILFPRIGGKSAIFGFISGFIAVYAVKFSTDVSFLLYGAIGLFTSVGMALLGSLFIPERKHTRGLTWRSLRED